MSNKINIRLTLKKLLEDRYSLSLLLIVTIYLITISLILLLGRYFFIEKRLIFPLIIILAALLGRVKKFIVDWSGFILLIILFDYMRGIFFGIILVYNFPIQFTPLIRFEKALFFCIPSVNLQQLLHQPGGWQWYDTLMALLHASHFVVFLCTLFLIWLKKPEFFNRFKWAILCLSYLGVITYLLYPAAPPWMASYFNLIPPLERVLFLRYNVVIPDFLIKVFDTNPIAAMPSLHAALPLLCFLVLWRAFRWYSMPFLLYLAMLTFALIYGGEHYVVDIIAGFIYAWLIYLLFFKLSLKEVKPKSLLLFNRGLYSYLRGIHFGLFISLILLSVFLTVRLRHDNYYANNCKKYLRFKLELSQPGVPLGDNNIVKGYYFEKMGMEGKALEGYKNALKNPKFRGLAHYYIALLYKRSGRLNLAKWHLDLADKVTPGNSMIHLEKGNLYLQEDKVELALQEYKKAIDLDERNIEAWLNIAALYEKENMYIKSAKYLKSCLPILPEECSQMKQEILTRINVYNNAIEYEGKDS